MLKCLEYSIDQCSFRNSVNRCPFYLSDITKSLAKYNEGFFFDSSLCLYKQGVRKSHDTLV